jgi:DNA-binding MarR family transcriptional regulator
MSYGNLTCHKVWFLIIIAGTMLLLKELPNSKSLEKLVKRYPDADIKAISDFVNLLRASSDLSSALDMLLAQHSLLQGRWWVLVLLMRQDDLTSSPTDLAEKAGVTKATMTGFIDGLEREGLVVRLLDTTDRRKLLIRLTPAGQQKMDEVMPDYYNKVKLLMSCLTVERRDAMVSAVKDLAANINAMK